MSNEVHDCGILCVLSNPQVLVYLELFDISQEKTETKPQAGEQLPERDSGHDSGRFDRRSCSLSFGDRISSSTESSEPCSHSIRKAGHPKFSAFIFRPRV